MLKVRSPQDFGSAIVFILIGLAGIYFGSDLTMGTAGRMGPGYFPRLLSWLIVAIGLFVGVLSLVSDGPPIQKPKFRQISFVLLAVVLFGYMMNFEVGGGQIGLELTAVVMVLVASLARPNHNLKEALILGLGLSIGTVLIFKAALGQPLPTPVWDSLVSVFKSFAGRGA